MTAHTTPASSAKPVAQPGQTLGTLYLVPAPLDFGCAACPPVTDSVPAATLQMAARLSCWICENAKSARAYLKRVAEHYPLVQPLQALHIQELPHSAHKHGDRASPYDARPLLANALTGQDIGLLSEAGLPAVADPGSSVVRAAHELGLAVVPLAGASSLLLAVAASGLNGQSFAFVGYLPQEANARGERIRQLQTLALRSGQTQLFIETPYRNLALWAALLQNLEHNTWLSVASGLTLASSQCIGRSVKQWRQCPCPVDTHTPAVFCLGR